MKDICQTGSGVLSRLMTQLLEAAIVTAWRLLDE
jgi:hypothetical protein